MRLLWDPAWPMARRTGMGQTPVVRAFVIPLLLVPG
jgi:hypothetical protein